VQINGNTAIAAEDLLAWELGYRTQPNDDFAWDLALFYNDYSDLIGVVPDGAPFFDPTIGGVIIPTTFANSLSGETYGAELAASWRIRPQWELAGAYTLLYMDIHAPEGNLIQGSSPHNQVYVRSSWNPREHWQVDFIGRYVDNLSALGVPSYLTGDVRVAWQPYKNLQWAVVGRNLIDSPHLEFLDPSSGTIASEVDPEVFTTLTWTY
jgi:iron complex outermembrane recepter protein